MNDSTPRLTVENVKATEFASEETLCFEAALYVDGKRTAIVSNDGRGGPHRYRVIDHSAFAWAEAAAAAADLPYDFERLDQLVDRLIASHVTARDDDPDECPDGRAFYAYRRPGVPAADHDNVRHAVTSWRGTKGDDGGIEAVTLATTCGEPFGGDTPSKAWTFTPDAALHTLTCPVCRDMNGLPAYGPPALSTDPTPHLGEFPNASDLGIMDAVAQAQGVVFAGAGHRPYRFVQVLEDGRIVTIGSIRRATGDPAYYGWTAVSHFREQREVTDASLTAAVGWLTVEADIDPAPAGGPPFASVASVRAAVITETLATLRGSRFYRDGDPLTTRQAAHAVGRTLDRAERDYGAATADQLEAYVDSISSADLAALYREVQERAAALPPDPQPVKVRDVLDGRYRPVEYDGLTIASYRVKGDDRILVTLETGVDAGGPVTGLNVMLDEAQTVLGVPATAS